MMIISSYIQTNISAAQPFVSAKTPSPSNRWSRSVTQYVHKNAVFAVCTIYREFEHLIPDAPKLLQTFFAAESDATFERNAFVFLAHCAIPKVVEWILSVYEQISGLVELLQMSMIMVI
jgi:vesicle coat complex subunit